MTEATRALTDAPLISPEWSVPQRSEDFRMPESFWDRFVGNHWTDGPLLIRSPFAIPLVTTQEVFEAVQAASDDHRVHGVSELMVFIDGGSRQCDIVDFLPKRCDSSLESYRQRLEDFLGNRHFTLLLPKLQTYNADLWMRVRRFLSGLYARVGVPGSMADLDIFYGRYDRTPHGIHRDEASNFSYVVSGTKRMLFWPEETFPGRTGKAGRLLGTMRYEAHLDTAIEIEAHEGDLLYWPASYWHIAVSDADWPLTLNINSYVGRPALHSLAQAIMTPKLGGLLDSRCKPLITVRPRKNSGASEQEVPEEVSALGQAMREIGNDERFRQTVEELWFRKLSATGFEVTPVPASIPRLSPEDILLSHPEFPILFVSRSDGSSQIFANGNAIPVASQPSIRNLVDRLNGGCKASVDTLISASLGLEAGNFEQARQLKEILSSLCSFRALTVSAA